MAFRVPEYTYGEKVKASPAINIMRKLKGLILYFPIFINARINSMIHIIIPPNLRSAYAGAYTRYTIIPTPGLLLSPNRMFGKKRPTNTMRPIIKLMILNTFMLLVALSA